MIRFRFLRRLGHGWSAVLDDLCLDLTRFVPLRFRYWITMVEIGHATRNSKNVPATPLDEILKNMRTPRKMQGDH